MAHTAPISTPFTPWAVLLAAGVGVRFGASQPKQYVSYRGVPLYWQSVLTMCTAAMAGVVVVFPAQDMDAEQARLATLQAQYGLTLPLQATQGGERRQDSVWAGLAVLPPDSTHVLIHDTARPFASPDVVRRVCATLYAGAKAVIPAIPLTDTVKEVACGRVVHTPPRDSLCAAQTPQGFTVSAVRQAHEYAQAHGITATDDASLLEACGIPVEVIPGEICNRKLTTPEDAAFLSASIPAPTPRTGFGYDVHRFGAGRPLKLGNVLMHGDIQVIAHSDGDVLLHALMDALLGCAGAGDIGLLFPDTDPAFAHADSALLLTEVLRITRAAGVAVTHVDCTVITQEPKIAPQREAIRARIAHMLGVDIAQVNVKATTEEGLGFTGAKKGIKAVAVVTAQHYGETRKNAHS